MVLIGFATRFNSTEHNVATYQALANKMLQYGLNAIRIGSSDLFNNNFPWNNGAAVQWFLDNTTFTVIIDRDHTIGLTSLTSAQITAINNHLAEMATRWHSFGDRIILEPVNEYGGTNFYSVMQGILDTFRNAGFNQQLIFNRMGFSEGNPDTTRYYPWQILNDPINRTIQGGHWYMNGAATQGVHFGERCYNEMFYGATATSQPLIGTEEGANYNEFSAFTVTNVAALNRYLELCYNAGFGNMVWLQHGLTNLPTYEALGLTFPIAPTPPPVYTCPTCGLSFNTQTDLDTHITTVHKVSITVTITVMNQDGVRITNTPVQATQNLFKWQSALSTDANGIVAFDVPETDLYDFQATFYGTSSGWVLITSPVSLTIVVQTVTPPPPPSSTVMARVPGIGNKAFVQVYLRRIRDRLFSRELHKKLHPVI